MATATKPGPDKVYAWGRITVPLTDDLAELLEAIAEAHYDGNRSEAVRDLIYRARRRVPT